jgi:DNA-binding response OmpR family regulator
MSKKILIVEDDAHIRLGLEQVLKSEGFETISCDKGDAAVQTAQKIQPLLIILDVMLPGMNGYDICKELRSLKIHTPILILTAKSQEIDKVVGLELGADDYVTKPFGVRELLARVQALLRRSTPLNSPSNEETLQIGKSIIDPKTFQIKRGNITEDLTSKELKLLQLFCKSVNQVLSRDKLLSEVWGYEYYGTNRTLDQTIAQLRKKLGDSALKPKYLLTVHGVGYKLVH